MQLIEGQMSNGSTDELYTDSGCIDLGKWLLQYRPSYYLRLNWRTATVFAISDSEIY